MQTTGDAHLCGGPGVGVHEAEQLEMLTGKGPSALDVIHDGLDHLRGGALPPNVWSVQLQQPREANINSPKKKKKKSYFAEHMCKHTGSISVNSICSNL